MTRPHPLPPPKRGMPRQLLMKYTPKLVEETPEDNVNIPHTSALGELFLLLGGLIGLAVAAYIALGLAVNVIVQKMPPELEHHLGFLVSASLEGHAPTEADAALQELVDRFLPMTPLSAGKYRVIVIPSAEANAMALPGGYIVVLSGLLKELHSENELAFILAHELGHFAHRDHLKGLGRGLALSAISTLLVGVDSHITKFILGSLVSVDMKFSQRQETDADLFALDLLNRRYGHIGGATDFFQSLADQEKLGRMAYFFATHPYPQDRVNALRKKIQERAYAEREEIPLDSRITSLPDASNATTFKDIFR